MTKKDKINEDRFAKNIILKALLGESKNITIYKGKVTITLNDGRGMQTKISVIKRFIKSGIIT
jgi:hypothetical protein